MKDKKCPFFIDFTRECIRKIGYMPSDSMFKFCSSSDFIDCPLYRALRNVGKHCKYISKCVAFKYYTTRNIDKFLKVTQHYCLTENPVNCARYRIKEKGEEPPSDLLPNGKKMVKDSSEE